MRKTIKNIILCISVIYFTLSLSYSVFSRGIYKETLEEIKVIRFFEINREKNKDEPTDQEIGINTAIEILNTNLKIAIVSICVGMFIGLIISIHQNSIAKYIVLFIFGEGIYCSLWTLIELLINYNRGNTFQTFFGLFPTTSKSVFLSFFIIYAIILAGIILNNKKKVKELNETLRGQKDIKTTKKISWGKIVIAIIVLILLIGGTIIARKTIILVNYSKKIKELNECNNYYVKEEFERKDSEEKELSYERYCKDNVVLIKKKNSIQYIDKNTKEFTSYSLTDHTVTFMENDEDYIVGVSAIYGFSGFWLNGEDVKIWKSIELAFQVKIWTEDYNGKKCYVIADSNGKTYIEKDTYLMTKKTQWVKDLKGEGERIYYYEYQFQNVTDSDVEKPY